MLIDSIAIQQDSISKQTADFALVTFAQSLKLTENQKKELIELLNEKYMVSDIKSIDDILYRIKSAMYATNEDANYFKELKLPGRHILNLISLIVVNLKCQAP